MTITSYLLLFYGWLWNGPLLLLLAVTSLILTYQLRGRQFFLLRSTWSAFSADHSCDEGDVSHLESLAMTLAGAVGTGSIVGVATAISIGGMGALLWMWVGALLTMVIKYGESLLALKYRSFDESGRAVGGPMHYMEQGLGWRKAPLLVAFLGLLATLFSYNMVQVHAMTATASQLLGLSPWLSASFIALAVGLVLFGGVVLLGRVASWLVPFMSLLYLLTGSYLLWLHLDRLPSLLVHIGYGAFYGPAMAGGVAGTATLWLALQMGFSTSLFANEAGLELPAIATAAAKSCSPARQGLIAMVGALLTTLLVCTMTALVIGVTEVHLDTALNGSTMAMEAFARELPGGAFILSICLVLFAYSTMLAWAYYGERCFAYLGGSLSLYRLLYLLAIFPAALLPLETIWALGNLANGLLLLPNLCALYAMRKVIAEETQLYYEQKRLSKEHLATKSEPCSL